SAGAGASAATRASAAAPARMIERSEIVIVDSMVSVGSGRGSRQRYDLRCAGIRSRARVRLDREGPVVDGFQDLAAQDVAGRAFGDGPAAVEEEKPVRVA